MNKKPIILPPEILEKKFLITMTLTGNETANFYYSSRDQARSHHLQLGATMSLAGQAIKKIEYIEL